MDYRQADDKLQGRNMLSRKVGNNTYLVRNSGVPGDSIHLKLHDTYIVTWHADGRIVLNSGGWRTVTTKARINEFTNLPGIWQERGVWYVDQNTIFEDGVTIHADGRITGGSPVKAAKKMLKLRASARNFAKRYAAAFIAGEVGAPSAGDCFYCAMREVGTGKPLGELTDADHLLSHIEEGYLVPSLLLRAMEVIPTSIAVKQSVAAKWENKPEYSFFKNNDKFFESELRKIVGRYVIKQLGQAA